MSNKLRKRARELAAREGISYQAAHNRLTEARAVHFRVDEWVPLPPLDDARTGAGDVTVSSR